jgi:hypothetical protein
MKFCRLILIGFVSFSLVLMLVATVSAQTFFKDIITEWESGDLSDMTVRVLFAFIVLMLVMTVVDRLPGLDGEGKSWLRWTMGIVVALLATAYLQIDELKATLFGYSALGFTMAIAVPFLILLFFTYDLLNSAKSGIENAFTRRLFAYIIWVGFAGFILYRIIKFSGGSVSVPEPLKYAHYILFLVALFILLFMKTFVKKIVRSDFEKNRNTLAQIYRASEEADILENREIDETIRATETARRRRK